MTDTPRKHARDFLIPYINEDGTPAWLKKLIQGAVDSNGEISDSLKDECYKDLLEEHKIQQPVDPDVPVPVDTSEPADIDATGTIRLKKITHEHGVNALMKNQELPLSDSCTIVYGLNGAGKSGYFRILHEIAGGEKQERILGNVHEEGEEELSVKIDYSIDDIDQETLHWNDRDERQFQEFQGIRVFDSEYVHFFLGERENVVDLEPMGLHIFDEIVQVIDEYKAKLDAEKGNLEQGLPDLSSTLDKLHSESMIAMLNGANGDKLNKELLDSFLPLSDSESSQLQIKKQELEKAKKQSTDADLKLLSQEKDSFTKLKQFFESKSNFLKTTKTEAIVGMEDLQEKQKLAKKRLAELEVLNSVPNKQSNEWKEFIKKGHEYTPLFGKEDKCPYCHQHLQDAAASLLQGYAVFLSDSTQKDLNTAKTAIQSIERKLDLASFSFQLTEEFQNKLEGIAYGESNLLLVVQSSIALLGDGKTALVKNLKESVVPTCELPDLSSLIQQLQTCAEGIESTLTKLKGSEEEKKESMSNLDEEIKNLEDRKLINEKKDAIKKYFLDKETIGIIKYATSTLKTKPLSDLCSTASEELITQDFRDNFAVQMKDLRKDHLPIEIPKSRVSKGRQKTRKKIQGYELKKVLSEGEQKAVALALFLAELTKDNQPNPIVLDDPVTSLDHEVIGILAEKIISLSSERQLIVFTHNKLFYDALLYWAQNHKDSNDSRTHHECKNYNGGCSKNTAHVYSFRVEKRSLSETGRITPKPSESAAFYLSRAEKEIEKDDWTVATVASELKHAIEHFIDEKILNNQRLIRDYGNKQGIKWDQLKKLNPDEQLIDQIKTYWDMLSSRGSHLSLDSTHNPLTYEELKTIIDFIKAN